MKLETWQILALVGIAGAAYWYLSRQSSPVSSAAGTTGNPMAASVNQAGSALMYNAPIGPTPIGYGTVLAPVG